MKKLMTVSLALILVLSFICVAIPAYATTKTVGNQLVIDSRDYPIIFIAGMGGSTLNRVGTSDNFWPGTFNTSSDEDFKYLALDGFGRNSPYGFELEAVKPMHYGGLNENNVPVYQGFYDYMEKEGYHFDTGSQGKAFFDFAYDFRKDNRLWTDDLDKKVDDVLKQTKSDKVILVCHSMGGIQARLYTKDPARASKVAAVVFMGTPHHGSVMPFWAMTQGYNFGNLRVSDSRMWEVMGNWVGGYQLLPDYPFLKDKDGNMHDIKWINTGEWISEQEYERIKIDKIKGIEHRIIFGLPNSDFANDSIYFHQQLNSSGLAPNVKYYMIEGTGQETVDYLEVSFEDVGLPKPVLHLKKHFSQEGDGTVPHAGAIVNGAEVIPVKSEHMALPGNADAQKELTKIRQEVNNEKNRNEIVTKITKMAEDNLQNAKPTTTPVAQKELTVAELAGQMIVWLISGMPDPEKQKLNEEIKTLGYQLLKDARANITITKGTDFYWPNKPDHFYALVYNYQLMGVGSGVINNANVDVTVDSYDTAIKALSNTDALAEAYTSRKITVSGAGGIMDKINARILEWISKYYKAIPKINSPFKG